MARFPNGGDPRYVTAERRVLGRMLDGEFPAALARTGAARWRQHADFSLAHARMRAERGDVERAGFRELHARFTHVPASTAALVEWVEAVRGQI